jgi:Leucine-rich repeat (LRR) protein
MRLIPSLALLVALVPFAHAGRSPEEAKEAEKIEKVGGKVTVDESLPEAARLRVTFRTLDDKTAASLKGLKRIAALTVEDASGLTDRTLAVLGTLTNLRELSLTDPKMTNVGMTSLKGLKELRKLYLIDADKVSDGGVAVLKGFVKLEELDLSGSGVTSGAGATFKTLTALKLLAVNKTKFGDAGVAQLKELRDLKKLEAVAAEVSEKAAKGLEDTIKGLRVRR